MKNETCSIDNDELINLIEKSKKAIKNNELKIDYIKKEIIKNKKDSREIDRKIRLLL